MLKLTLSNRFEFLLDALLDDLATPPASPFEREQVIVPSIAVRRSVELALTDRFGICANIEFSFLAQWLWRQIGQVLPVPENSPFSPPVLTWRVVRAFTDKAFVAQHPPLTAYLQQADPVMRYELAAQTAALLGQYLTYRTDWLAAWLAGKSVEIKGLDDARMADEQWQAALWRRIAAELGTDSRHPSLVFFDAMKGFGSDAAARAGLPAAAHIFCLPSTPPLYLSMLQRLAQWIDVHLYVLNPCQEYWFEVVDPRRLAYLTAAKQAQHHEVGNRLLAAWGRQTQAHIDLLLAGEGAAEIDDAGFVAADGASLLATVQNAILDMTEPDRGSVVLADSDRSIEVQVCHSPSRELEVLQDQLLALFAGRNPPKPSEVLVVLPDLEAAAPLIDAVFGNAPRARRIPYMITGRPASALNPCAQALLALLAVATSRFQASAVFELLQQDVIARRFGIDGAAREAIHSWIQESGIRWALDGRQRGEFGLPIVDRHTFRDGLDRLFLGYALPASSVEPVAQRLPAGNPEGSAAQALGSFQEFVRQLGRLHAGLAQTKTPTEWRQLLLGVLENFLAPLGDEIDDAIDVASAIRELHADMTDGGISESLPAEVMRAALDALLQDTTRGGVPTGSVTFAAMQSLRALPYRIVCVLGLNDGAFPSRQRPIEFDLMTHDARRGDRQRRTDERNVFLDLLLAARERLYLSYTGKSVRDNAPLPPSVLVSELLDYCTNAIDQAPFSAESLKAARRRLCVEHPLQAFSIEYFAQDADPRRRSFNEEYCDALKQQLAAAAQESASVAAAQSNDDDADEGEDDNAASEPQGKFFAAPLPLAGPEFRELTLDNLIRFFRNPCKYLLRERLGIVLAKGEEELQDDEPFAADWNARTELAQRVLPHLLRGEALADIRTYAHAGVEYPPGKLGGIELDRELQQMEAFARQLSPALLSPTLEPVSGTVEFEIDDERWRISDGFGDLRADGLCRYRYDDVRAGDYVDGWIRHLFLNVLAPAGVERQTIWHSRNGRYVLPPINSARGHLETLLRLYRDGLHAPLHFFPKSAWSYIKEGADPAKASATWRSTPSKPRAEDSDAAYRLALRGVDEALDEQFFKNAVTVFSPLLEVIKDEAKA